jgi:tripartite-type tricarboxylate transporter receptor subunit TctC
MFKRTATACVTMFCVASTAGTQALADDFYAGRTITMSTHTAPGGGYDTLLRMMARHYSTHIPGKPSILVVNMPGAGGLTAFNHAAKSAPQDGTFLTLVGQGLVVHEPTGQPGLQASLGSFKWIGNFSQAPNITAVWYTSPTKTIEDAKQQDVIVGSTGAGSPDGQIPTVYNALLGTRFKVVYGYAGGGPLNLAMERGEIEGRGTNTWPSYKATMARAVQDRQLVALIQIGMKKDNDLPNVPLFLDLVKGDAVREPVARFLSLSTAISRPLAAPPGVPDARVEVLRRAFDATVKDNDFITEAQRLQIDLDPMTGEEVQAAIIQILATPKDVIERTKAALNGNLR